MILLLLNILIRGELKNAITKTLLCSLFLSYNKLHMAPKENGERNWIGDDWGKTSVAFEKIMKEAYVSGSCNGQGRSQDFSKAGGSHCIKVRVLTRLS